MDIIVNGFSIIAITMGIVEFASRLGVKGKFSLTLSVVTGTVLGIIGRIIEGEGVPTTADGWAAAVLSGFILGLSTSGLYDVAKNKIGSGIKSSDNGETIE